jgi:hypothetical protein
LVQIDIFLLLRDPYASTHIPQTTQVNQSILHPQQQSKQQWLRGVPVPFGKDIVALGDQQDLGDLDLMGLGPAGPVHRMDPVDLVDLDQGGQELGVEVIASIILSITMGYLTLDLALDLATQVILLHKNSYQF